MAEIYIDVRLDFVKDVFQQSSISATEANKIVQYFSDICC